MVGNQRLAFSPGKSALYQIFPQGKSQACTNNRISHHRQICENVKNSGIIPVHFMPQKFSPESFVPDIWKTWTNRNKSRNEVGTPA